MVEQAAGVDRATAEQALQAAKNQIPVALIMLKTGVTRAEAVRRLKRAQGNVRRAIEENLTADDADNAEKSKPQHRSHRLD